MPESDVRMRGFGRRATVEAALAWLDAELRPLDDELASLAAASGRVLAESITSTVDVPRFDRAMMDGVAVQSASTLGATPYNRLPLALVDEAFPGRESRATVGPGEGVKIMTGAPMPQGADAVLPAEQIDLGPAAELAAATRGATVYAQGDVSPGKHVGYRGEDITAGTEVLPKGRVLRPQDLGVLSSIGVAEVRVIRKPRVELLVTGDELAPPGTRAEGAKITDANGPMLAALVTRDGGAIVAANLLADDRAVLKAAVAASTADVVLISGGSSVGQEDHAPLIVAELGELAIHGVAMRPSSPTGMGRVGSKLVFLLPGNPVSCLCAYDFFAGRAIRAFGGRTKTWPYRSVPRKLRRKLVSVIGRLDYARVQLVKNEVEPLAISGASILSSTTRADGFVIVGADSEGFPPGAEVEVFLYDNEPMTLS